MRKTRKAFSVEAFEPFKIVPTSSQFPLFAGL